jgi:O-glycosyl hydrolase
MTALIPGAQPPQRLGQGRLRWTSWFMVLSCRAVLTGVMLFAARVHSQPVTVVIDGSRTYQTIDGFGVNANARSWTNSELQPVLDTLIDQGGMTLFRVLHDKADWEALNDNADPNVMDWSYYTSVYSSPDFEAMWGLVGYLNGKGITNGVMFNFQGTGPAWMMDPQDSSFLGAGFEDEWAEMVASLLVYARNERHLQFGMVGAANEPDLTGLPPQGICMSRDQYVSCLDSLAGKLDANSLSDLGLVGPDLALSKFDWMSAMMNDPLLMAKLAHWGLHSYEPNGGGSLGVYDFLQQSASSRNFWMTEFNVWCSSCESCEGPDDAASWQYSRSTAEYLLAHLANGASAALVWEGYDSYYHIRECWSYWGLLGVDDINAVPRTYTPRKHFYTVAQVSKFVRPGARRIEVSGAAEPLTLLGFYGAGSGQLALTGINSSPDPVSLVGTLTNLPALSSLDLYYTDSATNLCWAGAIAVSNGVFSALVPPDCVFTLWANGGVWVSLTNPAEGATFRAPAIIALQANASSAEGVLAGVEFFNGTNKLGECFTSPYSLEWSNVPAGAYVLSAKASNSLGVVGSSPDVHVTVVGPMAQIRVTPVSATVISGETQQFTAVAEDALGASLDPQPPFVWSVTGGGNVTTNGCFISGGSFGGPFVVSACSAGAKGTSSVSVLFNGLLGLPAQAAQALDGVTQLVVTNSAAARPLAVQLTSNTFAFRYRNRDELLADGWSFMATLPDGTLRDTEITDPADGALISCDQDIHPGILRIPCDVGDLWGSANDSRNSLFRPLPTNWLSLQLELTFAPVVNFQQAHLGLYQDDDNYLQVGVAYNDIGADGAEFSADLEALGTPVMVGWIALLTNQFQLLLAQNPASGNISASCSVDGENWTVIAVTNWPLMNPQVSIWTGGSPGGLSNCDLSRFTMMVSNAVPTVLSYALLQAPDGATIDTNGVIRWQPVPGVVPSTHVFTTVVTDNGIPPVRATNSFSVYVGSPPVLSAGLASNGVVVSWSSTLTNFVLESARELGSDVWTAVTNTPQLLGAQASVVLAPEQGQQFFRLRQP